jgi:hypothetical protein
VNVADHDRHGHHALARPADAGLLILIGLTVALLERLAPVDALRVEEVRGQAAGFDIEIATGLA